MSPPRRTGLPGSPSRTAPGSTCWTTSTAGPPPTSQQRNSTANRTQRPPSHRRQWRGTRIGYIGFSLFTPALATPILDALNMMRDAPGLIIDVRGNYGGSSHGRRQPDRLLGPTNPNPSGPATGDGSGDTHATPSTDPYRRPRGGAGRHRQRPPRGRGLPPLDGDYLLSGRAEGVLGCGAG
jgi:hypothetical protein